MGIISELYELTNDYDEVYNLALDEDWDPQVAQDTLEGIFGEIEDKAENCAKIIKMLQAKADAANAEADRLYGRAKALSSRIDFFKSGLFENMKAVNVRKIKTSLFTISIAKNGGKEPLVITGSLDEIPGKYLIPQDPKPNNDAIRTLLAEKEVDWAHLEPRGEHLGIR